MSFNKVEKELMLISWNPEALIRQLRIKWAPRLRLGSPAVGKHVSY